MKMLLSSAAAIAFATAATAGSPFVVIPEPPVVVAPPAAASTWDGFYAGGLYSSYSATETYQGDIDSSNIGVFAGYNFQNNALVFGGELAYAMGDYDTTDPSIMTHIPGFAGDVTVLDLKARVGFALSSSAMVYGFGGYTAAQIDNSGTVADFAGLNYGAGAAFQLNNGIFFGLEYIARDLDGSGIADGETLTADAVEARIGWQF